MLRKCLSDGKALVIEGLHCHAVRFRCRVRCHAHAGYAAHAARGPQGLYAARLRALSAEEPTRQAPVVVPIALQLTDADRRVRRMIMFVTRGQFTGLF